VPVNVRSSTLSATLAPGSASANRSGSVRYAHTVSAGDWTRKTWAKLSGTKTPAAAARVGSGRRFGSRTSDYSPRGRQTVGERSAPAAQKQHGREERSLPAGDAWCCEE